MSPGWRFDNSYARLPERFFANCNPLPVRRPQLAIFNRSLAESLELSIDTLPEDDAAALFAGNVIPSGAAPIAQAYAGHQFGGFTMLGDGRAILLGEHVIRSGERFDIQLKGSGPTRFSRRGDGRATLASMLREYIISEGMHALRIPTTRSLAVCATGEAVYRERPSMGAVLTRVAASHIRVGTFEYFAANKDHDGLQLLADYTIKRHFPTLDGHPTPYVALLEQVMERQAELVASWMLVGFVHGVMNTDNMSIAGETIDYGPCAFMDHYDEKTVFSSIDHDGRYAFGNQPHICLWNLTRFAEALLPLLHAEEQESISLATTVLERFPGMFQQYWLAGMRRKIGLLTVEDDDELLVQSLLKWMQRTEADYTNTFRNLADALSPTKDKQHDNEFANWISRWHARLDRSGEPKETALEVMRQSNPAIIPRNHRVEEALKQASDQGDVSSVLRLLEALRFPYENRPEHVDYQSPSVDSQSYRTFCGT